ncbi:MAG TPA: hydrogenase maturation nickel metallochaperone HypA [Methylococcaceae bacterium]|nr:hydrogenase maturation nickel metallochaperone HypA [Methylococcaceae bacterium]
MHELSLCEDLLEQVLAIAREHRAQKVAGITVRIGPLSGIEPLLLESAFSIGRVGTLAAQAELIMERQPVRVLCGSCGAETEAGVSRLLCGICGGNDTKLLSGDELILASVELLNAAEPSPLIT